MKKLSSFLKISSGILAKRQNWTQVSLRAVKRRPFENVHNRCCTWPTAAEWRGGVAPPPPAFQILGLACWPAYRRLLATHLEQINHHPRREGEKSTQV